MAELSPILAELERLVPLLQVKYGLGTEDPPIVSLASMGRKRTQTGWYTPSVWVDAQEDTLAALAGVGADERKLVSRAEVVIATEILGDPVQTVSELLRQLVVHQRGPKHVTGMNGYYPIIWRRLGWQYDHQVTVLDTQPSRGWSDWQPGPTFRTWAEENVNTAPFEVARNKDHTKERPGSRMKKWRCDCTTIRCATKVRAFCVGCGKQFEWAESKEVCPPGWNGGDPDLPEFINTLVAKVASHGRRS